jgi:hypothetical protein
MTPLGVITSLSSKISRSSETPNIFIDVAT